MKRGAEAMEIVEVAAVDLFPRPLRIASGIMVSEMLDIVAKKASVDKELLYVEMLQDGEEAILLSSRSTLLLGCKYSVSVSGKVSRGANRTFAAGIAAIPGVHYFIAPKVDKLVRDLINRKYCVLVGPRQSGKTTSALAAKDQILAQNNICVVYLDGVLGRSSWDSSRLWGLLWDALHFKCPGLFPERSSAQPCDYLHFSSLFLKSRLLTPVIIILDEADALLNLSAACLDEFFHAIRALKQDAASYNLHSFLLIGVETVRDLLEGQYDRRVEQSFLSGRVYVPGTTPTRLSPFPHDHVFPAQRFNAEDVVQLLSQAAVERVDVKVDVTEIAASIMEWSGGHKGLVGTCLAYLVQEELWSFKQWLSHTESYRFGTYVFGKATYARILAFFRQQSAGDPKASEFVLELLAVEKKPVGPDTAVNLRDWIAHGVLEVISGEGSGSGEALRISSPLLRTAMLWACVITNNNVDPAPQGVVLDRKWVILQALSTLDGAAMIRSECLKADGSPAEYAQQFLFMFRVKSVLQQAYPSLNAKVLPEVREVAQPGVKRSQLRLDTLVRDSDSFSKFGFELVANGNAANVLAHIEKAKTYHRQHSAQVFVINFCMEKEDEVLKAPDHDSLVFISANFWPSKGVAKVTFMEPTGDIDETEVTLKNWDGAVSFVF